MEAGAELDRARGGASVRSGANDGAVREPETGPARDAVAAGTLPAMRVRVDVEACTGHGRCYSLAPEMFSADDVGHCVLVHEEVPEGLEGQARLGVQNCPERAISVED